jgi:hypothetical protein
MVTLLRKNRRADFGGVLVCLLLAVAACTAKPERATLDEFFTQSKLYDKTALQHISTVIFDPTVDGIVETFEVKDITDDGVDRKTVTAVAQVKMPGTTAPVEKTILLTLAKRDRWIVTGFIERAGKPVPAAPRS